MDRHAIIRRAGVVDTDCAGATVAAVKAWLRLYRGLRWLNVPRWQAIYCCLQLWMKPYEPD